MLETELYKHDEAQENHMEKMNYKYQVGQVCFCANILGQI